MNKQGQHLPILDCFRGLAIFTVICRHFLMTPSQKISELAQTSHNTLLHFFFFGLQQLFELGDYGVAIFFVISGFCIHLSYRRSSNPGWMIFFTRRVFRIYPAYLLSLFLFIVLLPNTRFDWPFSMGNQIDVLLHLFLLHNLIPQTFTSINVVYWSLAIEFQLYLLYPLLLGVARGIGWRRTLVITAAVEVASRISLALLCQREPDPAWWGWINLCPLSFWFSWSIGAALAEAFVENQTLPFAQGPIPLWLWPVIALVINNIPYLQNFAFPITALGTVRFLAYFLSRDKVSHKVSANFFPRFLSFLGVISYSLYLFHVPLLAYLLTFRPDEQSTVFIYAVKFIFMIGAPLATIALSYVIYRLVEMPGINAGKKVITWLSLRRASINPA